MAQKLLFDDQCEFSLGGIKKLYLSTVLNKPFPYYPLDYFVSANTITTINENITFEEITVIDALVNQTRESDEKSKWFNKDLKFSISKITLDSNQFLNSFLFKKNIVSSGSTARPTNLDNYNTTAIFQDMNDHWWIAGFDIAFKVFEFQLTTGDQGGENQYDILLKSRSYDRIRKIEVVETDCGIIYNQITTTTTTAEIDCGYTGVTAVEIGGTTTTTTTTTSTTTTTTTTSTTTTTTTTAEPEYFYQAYEQVCSGDDCGDSGDPLIVESPIALGAALYSEGATAVVYRITSAVSPSTPDYVFTDPISRASNYCCA
jgi:hypothetical protein